MSGLEENLSARAYTCLMQADPQSKCRAVSDLFSDLQRGRISIDSTSKDVPRERVEQPGRPSKPVLVSPHAVPKRGFRSIEGRVRLAHAIAHIEFNAINLALDAVYRFDGMPARYYSDWMRVAAEEAKHFELLCAYLENHGGAYGDYPAHNGLWEMAVRTDHDVMVRMALVPRVLEARGLDVTPTMIEKLRSVGDQALIDVLEVIYHEEKDHVLIGSRWFNHVCEERSLPGDQTFIGLLKQYDAHIAVNDIDPEVREQAGFSREEIESMRELFA